MAGTNGTDGNSVRNGQDRTERSGGRIRTGVLYCGGCNSYFDRAQLFRDVAAEFSGICDFSPFRESGSYDLVLLINGCQSECLMEADYGSSLIVLNNMNYRNFSNIISDAIKQIRP